MHDIPNPVEHNPEVLVGKDIAKSRDPPPRYGSAEAWHFFGKLPCRLTDNLKTPHYSILYEVILEELFLAEALGVALDGIDGF